MAKYGLKTLNISIGGGKIRTVMHEITITWIQLKQSLFINTITEETSCSNHAEQRE
jgi:hypothetical protein